MKPHILFIQGGGQGAYEEDGHLVASLRHALGSTYEVCYPKMPVESDPDYERWKPRIKRELASLGPEVILIGHSLGGSALLKYVLEERIEHSVSGIFLLATPYWGGDDTWQYDAYTLPKNVASKLPSHVPIFLYHGRDDEIVPFAHLARYADRLPQATIRALDGRGHQFNNDVSDLAADITRLRQESDASS